MKSTTLATVAFLAGAAQAGAPVRYITSYGDGGLYRYRVECNAYRGMLCGVETSRTPSDSETDSYCQDFVHALNSAGECLVLPESTSVRFADASTNSLRQLPAQLAGISVRQRLRLRCQRYCRIWWGCFHHLCHQLSHWTGGLRRTYIPSLFRETSRRLSSSFTPSMHISSPSLTLIASQDGLCGSNDNQGHYEPNGIDLVTCHS
jgi:hypothetical protein